MMRVHCFVSCVCELLKREPGFDERPFYFGVWDADFAVTDQHALSYHSEQGDQSFFRTWYERLYGVPIHEWYERERSKQENIERLSELVESRPEHRSVMVMLDLYCLPERENKFNQNPFPHYVMLEATADAEQWLMLDPDFRWQGELPKARVLEAVRQPSVAGGYYFDAIGVKAPTNAAVQAYFEACLKPDNALTEAVRTIVQAHLSGNPDVPLSGLTRALRELPVLALRKYAYEHGFAFYWRALGLSSEEFATWCAEVDALVKTYTLIQYRAIKLAATGQSELREELVAMLARQDLLERRIKGRLLEVFEQWCTSTGQRAPSRASARAGALGG